VSDDLHSEWARVFTRALAASGVSHAVVSPGSRSTPLALALASEPEIAVHVVVDERSAAFFALGQARISGRPSVVLCTSGTAAGHYLPAVLEAERARLPLVVLSADRPWELTDAHANQTLDQTKLFGSHVRAFLELGVPEVAALEAVPRIAAAAVLRATSPLPGPVHVNARFRKPLEPVASHGDEAWRAKIKNAPRTFAPALAPSDAAIERVAELSRSAERGLVVAGPLVDVRGERSAAARRLRASLAGFLRATGFALAAESTSGVLHGAEVDGLALSGFDRWLPPLLDAADGPDVLIEIGSPATSGAWQRALPRFAGRARVIVTADGIPDPHGTATDVVIADAADLFDRVSAKLSGTPASTWRETLARHATEAHAAPDSVRLDEPTLVRRVVSTLPSPAVLMLGNSGPVRDVDVFAGRTSAEVTVLHQRGVSGIDGVIAGAAGARSVATSPVVALLGDVSALHDVGSLATLADVEGPLAVVVVNNGGGRIFERLPVAERVPRETFERLFLTPPPDFLEHAARAFGVEYARADSIEAFDGAMDRALGSSRPLLIEGVVR
jgi:2-succinyl-5-enolpyruvyl-6-hydroxy-3-cyclohexene-1-carboxylate synthase